MNSTFMHAAIRTAMENMEKGGGPFGAVIVRKGKIISMAGNQVTSTKDPTSHAEIIAIRKAAKKLSKWDLSDCEIYCSCEPCPMCLGAIYWAHIPSVYYGARKEDAEAAGFDDSLIYQDMLLPPGERKIKMKNSGRMEAIECFKKWNALSYKIRY